MRKKGSSAVKENIFTLIEGYYVVSILKILHDNGCIDYPSGRLNMDLFKGKNPDHLLRLLYEKTDILRKEKAGEYVLTKKYRHYLKLGFHIDKLVSAYAQFSLSPGKWINPDPECFSNAFVRASDFWDHKLQLDLLKKLEANTILDLGCGHADLLMKFCHGSDFARAFGIELNPFLYGAAIKAIRQKRLTKRLRLIQGDAFFFEKYLSASQIRSVDVIYAANYLNEYCNAGGERLVQLLRKMKAVFPGRKLMIVDYYSVLHRKEARQTRFQYWYLHDIIQLMSGQGLPPASYKDWNVYYKNAGCVLENVIEGPAQGIQWFIHVVALAGV